MNYQFDDEEAKTYGVDEAIMLNNLRFWILKNKANGKHHHEGRTWTYNKLEAFPKLFKFWTRSQVERIINSLVKQGVVLKGNFNATAYDRTCWYAFSDESKSLKDENHFRESRNGKRENKTPIPDSKPDTLTDTKPLSTDGESERIDLETFFEQQKEKAPLVPPPPPQQAGAWRQRSTSKTASFQTSTTPSNSLRARSMASATLTTTTPK